MSIPYYRLQSGSHKNALIDDDRPKYWTAAPNCTCDWAAFQNCFYICKYACVAGHTPFEAARSTSTFSSKGCKMAEHNGIKIAAMDLCADKADGAIRCGEGGYHYTRPEVLVDKCFLTTYKVRNITGTLCVDEFGDTVSMSKREGSRKVKLPSTCSITMCSSPVCSITQMCAGCEYYFHLGDCTSRTPCVQPTNCWFKPFYNKCAGLDHQSCTYFEACDNGFANYCTTLRMCSACSVPQLDDVAYVCMDYSACRTCVTSSESNCLRYLQAEEDVIRTYLCGCTCPNIFQSCLTTCFSYTTAGCVQPHRSIGAALSVDESARKIHQLIPTSFQTSANCFGACGCFVAGKYTAGWLMTSRLPGIDELSNCRYNGQCCTSVECAIALPACIFPNDYTRTAFDDYDNETNVTKGNVIVDANKYDRIDFLKGRYFFLNSHVASPQSRRYGKMGYPIVYDTTTCVIKTFEPFHQCCGSWQGNNCCGAPQCENRFCCMLSAGYATITPRDTIYHIWAMSLREIQAREFCLDGTPIPGACMTMCVDASCYNQMSSIDFTYDKPNDAIIASVIRLNPYFCGGGSAETSTAYAGHLDPVVHKLPTNILQLSQAACGIDKTRCVCCFYPPSLCIGEQNHVGFMKMCFTGGCCCVGGNCDYPGTQQTCGGYCIRCRTLSSDRIFQYTPGCFNDSISQQCVCCRMCCYSGEAHPDHIYLRCLYFTSTKLTNNTDRSICSCRTNCSGYTFTQTDNQIQCDPNTKSPGAYRATWIDIDR